MEMYISLQPSSLQTQAMFYVPPMLTAHTFSRFSLVLHRIHLRPCRTVDHRIRVHLAQRAFNRLAIGDVQLHIRRSAHRRAVLHAAVRRHDIADYLYAAACNQLIDNVMAQLAADARSQYLYILTPTQRLPYIFS